MGDAEGNLWRSQRSLPGQRADMWPKNLAHSRNRAWRNTGFAQYLGGGAGIQPSRTPVTRLVDGNSHG